MAPCNPCPQALSHRNPPPPPQALTTASQPEAPCVQPTTSLAAILAALSVTEVVR